MTRNEKFHLLAEQWGYDDPWRLVQANLIDSVSPGICMNPLCDYSTEVEPDSDAGWCEMCHTQSVTSVHVLAGVI